jgi:hypothetical protein
VRCRESHIFWAVGSKMAGRLSALCAGSPFTQGRFKVLISVGRQVTVRIEVQAQLKNPMTSWGNELATFRYSGRRLNCATACPRPHKGFTENIQFLIRSDSFLPYVLYVLADSSPHVTALSLRGLRVPCSGMPGQVVTAASKELSDSIFTV